MKSESTIKSEIKKYIESKKTLEQKRMDKTISPQQFEVEWTIIDEKTKLLSWVLLSDEETG